MFSGLLKLAPLLLCFTWRLYVLVPVLETMGENFLHFFYSLFIEDLVQSVFLSCQEISFSKEAKYNVILNLFCLFMIALKLFGIVFFRKYSAIRRDGSFHHVHSTPFGNYSFISVDATLYPGPKRPYNFFGILDEVQ